MVMWSKIGNMRIAQVCAAATAAFLTFSAANAAEQKPASLKISSPAFQDGQSIPAQYTCDGEKISPPLKWSDAPAGAKSFALICDDPDAPAGTWTHWLVYGIPASTTELPEKTPATDSLPDGAHQGINSFKRVGYGAPCPPHGKSHRYIFKLYALDADLALKPRATKKQLVLAMKGHILAQGEFKGMYQRKG